MYISVTSGVPDSAGIKPATRGPSAWLLRHTRKLRKEYV